VERLTDRIPALLTPGYSILNVVWALT
jgi:hypothetical protein